METHRCVIMNELPPTHVIGSDTRPIYRHKYTYYLCAYEKVYMKESTVGPNCIRISRNHILMFDAVIPCVLTKVGKNNDSELMICVITINAVENKMRYLKSFRPDCRALFTPEITMIP